MIAFFQKKKYSNNKIIVFANYDYLPVLENWFAAMCNIEVADYLVVSLDERLHDVLERRGIDSMLRPCELDLGKLWIHRVEVLLELMEEGYDVIHSDADAIWLKDPQPYLQSLRQDMIFSQGTIWPPDVQDKWGFVLCCGFFMLRSNKKTLQFVNELLQRVKKDKDDQVSCNRILMEQAAVWNKPAKPYTIDFRGKQFVCSQDTRVGKCGKLTLALLPHKQFQRIYEKSEEVYIRHLISEKNSEHIVDVLKNAGCCFSA